MFGAELVEVVDAGGAAVVPGVDVVGVVVEGVVVASGEGAFGVAESEPVAHGGGEAVVFAADFQGCAVAGVDQDAVEGFGAVGDEVSGHGGWDGSVAVEDRGFLGGSEEGHDRDGDQDLRPGYRNITPRPCRGKRRTRTRTRSRNPGLILNPSANPSRSPGRWWNRRLLNQWQHLNRR